MFRPPMRAALFDMDRTLVRKETASLYVRHQLELGEARRRDLIRVTWWVLQYTLGIVDVPVVAAKAARSFAGTFEPAFAARCDDWCRRWVEPHVADAGREAVLRHRARGELCAIVTGASRHAAWPLARRLGIEHVVASELEVDASGRFTGRYVEPLCIGAERSSVPFGSPPKPGSPSPRRRSTATPTPIFRSSSA